MPPDPDRVRLARDQLARAQVACIEPVDWSDLTLYGFDALENAVVAAADVYAIPWSKNHPSKVEAARLLHANHGLPDVSALLAELNTLRKSEAYGESLALPSLEAEQLATKIEDFIEAVASAIGTSQP